MTSDSATLAGNEGRARELAQFRLLAPYAVRRVIDGRAETAEEAVRQLRTDFGPSVRADAVHIVEKAVTRFEEKRAENTDTEDSDAQ